MMPPKSAKADQREEFRRAAAHETSIGRPRRCRPSAQQSRVIASLRSREEMFTLFRRGLDLLAEHHDDVDDRSPKHDEFREIDKQLNWLIVVLQDMSHRTRLNRPKEVRRMSLVRSRAAVTLGRRGTSAI